VNNLNFVPEDNRMDGLIHSKEQFCSSQRQK